MLRIGHHGAAMLAYAPVIALSSGELRWIALCALPVALLASRLPDVDRRLPLVPHRGPTHTIWFAALVAIGSALGLGAVLGEIHPTAQATVALAALAGAISHVLADGLTPAGVRPLWPLLDRSISLRFARASSTRANWVLFGAGLLAISLALGTGPLAWPPGGG